MPRNNLDVILIRHGEVDESYHRCFLGRTNPHLSEHGRQQAQAVVPLVREMLAATKPAALWVSPLQRALESAEPIAGAYELSPQYDERLQEINFGDWDGLTFDQIEELAPGAVMRWYDDPIAHPAPSGESLADVDERVANWLAEREEEQVQGGGPLIVVAHFGVCCVLAARLMAIPVAAAERMCLSRGQCGRITNGALRVWGLPLAAHTNR